MEWAQGLAGPSLSGLPWGKRGCKKMSERCTGRVHTRGMSGGGYHPATPLEWGAGKR